ncbi:MAG: TolC family protein [Planctomycetales bacterium]|nr:TolC family protein [Planctomycetales bacterium]
MNVTLRLCAIPVCLLLGVLGCSRSHYRIHADRQAYSVLDETRCAPWYLPPGFRVVPDPASRFYDRSDPDHPELPVPAPQLYSYCLPELPQRDPGRLRGPNASAQPPADPQPPVENTDEIRDPSVLPPPTSEAEHTQFRPPVNRDVIGLVAFLEEESERRRLTEARPPTIPQQAGRTNTGDGPLLNTTTDETAEEDVLDDMFSNTAAGGLRVVAIPKPIWQSLPPGCLTRMMEFASIRREYERSHETTVPQSLRDSSPRMALEDIIEQAQINRREYQTQKETLYRAALALTLERFAYDIKFSPTGNGGNLDFITDRNGGVTVNRLNITEGIGVEKMLATGGDFFASFANSVLLTFNGTDGFTADIGSSIMLEFEQALIQRDRNFESLTQAERDLVYAARDFARARKILFRDLASQYYRLILTYRRIEISSQDYFSNLRGYNQSEAEYQAGRLPRFQVDQFEQDALRSRSELISSCNDLEQALDNLKFAIGLPPELRVNIDLTELEQLTLRDETTVSAELVRRARRTLVAERTAESPDLAGLLNGALDLVRRSLNLNEVRGQLSNTSSDDRELARLARDLAVEEARLMARRNEQVLAGEKNAATPPPPLRVFQRTMDAVDANLELIGRQISRYRNDPDFDSPQLAPVSRDRRVLVERFFAIRDELNTVVVELREALERQRDEDNMASETQLNRIRELVNAADELLRDARELRGKLREVLGQSELTAVEARDVALRLIDESIQRTANEGAGESQGLVPIELDMDEAMLTALVQRFDLMNERGRLADVWRQIKLAGDDLRSILNLSASHTIRRTGDTGRFADFSFDDSTTNIGLRFDAPLNRRSQRNTYRLALINYNQALRSLMEAEDDIKLSIRSDLRQLQLDREQYQIAIASAALAFERVVSTRLQLRLGVQNVAARDFLESQQAYTESLSAVASQHIGFVIDRIQLFLDLELLQVDETGFWLDLYDEKLQPYANVVRPPCSGPAYGCIPPWLCYSDEVRRICQIPFGTPEIQECPESSTALPATEEDGAAEEPNPSSEPAGDDRENKAGVESGGEPQQQDEGPFGRERSSADGSTRSNLGPPPRRVPVLPAEPLRAP